MESIYPKLALCGRKNECARTDTVFFPISKVSKGTVSLRNLSKLVIPTTYVYERIMQTKLTLVLCYPNMAKKTHTKNIIHKQNKTIGTTKQILKLIEPLGTY